MPRFTLSKVPWNGDGDPIRHVLEESLIEEGYDPFAWVDEPGKRYEAHAHAHDEIIWIIRGSMQFDVGGKVIDLAPGDRLNLPHASEHEATVGPEGCEYLVGQRL